jgi:hypothetical protein
MLETNNGKELNEQQCSRKTRMAIGELSELRKTSGVLPPTLGESESVEKSHCSRFSPSAQVRQMSLWSFFSFVIFFCFWRSGLSGCLAHSLTHTVVTVALNCELTSTLSDSLLDVVKSVEWFETDVLAENVALDPPRQNLEKLVAHVSASRNGEDVVQLFEGALFCFGDPEEDHEKGDDVEAAE